MGNHCGFADEQDLRYLLGAKTFGQEVQHFPFPPGKNRRLLKWRMPIGRCLNRITHQIRKMLIQVMNEIVRTEEMITNDRMDLLQQHIVF